MKIPHITLFDDADITEILGFRKASKQEALDMGVKLTPLAFIVKAVAKALVDFPRVNSSSLDGDNLVIKKYVHMGVAVDTPQGLMVPVIKDADKKGVYEIAKDIIDFVKLARDCKLTSKDIMQGGTFIISSLGGLGTTAFTPIVNMPEVAILEYLNLHKNLFIKMEILNKANATFIIITLIIVADGVFRS